MRRRRYWLTALLMGLTCSVAQATVQCPQLFTEVGAPNLYYALVFVDPSSPQERDRLVGQVSPLLSDIARKLGDRSGSKKRLQLELIACEHQVSSNDFKLDEMRDFLNYKVIAVFWKGLEDGQPGLVQLAVPIYLRVEGASRRDAEVVTVYAGRSPNPVDSWIEVLGGDASIYKPFVAMGLATVYQRESEYKTAWLALCESRVGLATLASDTLRRPRRERLDTEIAAQIVGLMKELEQAANRAGVKTLPPCTIPASTATPP